MPDRRPSAFDRSMIVPALVAFVIGMVIGIVLEGPVVGLALGVALAVSAVVRRWATARLTADADEGPRRRR